MLNEYKFLTIYRKWADQRASETEIFGLYKSLQQRVDGLEIESFFLSNSPTLLEAGVAMDAVAHAIHHVGDCPHHPNAPLGWEILQHVFPGADYPLFKATLDELRGTEAENEVRQYNRGFFTTLFSEDGVFPLEKMESQVGRTTKDDILPAIEEYKRLLAAGIASDGEVLTLHRFDPANPRYRQEVRRRGLDKEENEPMIVGGPASVEMVDRQGHLITMDAMDEAFGRFMANFRSRNAMAMHTDVQVGHAMPAYINRQGEVFKSGVDKRQLWVITELRKDTVVARRVIDEITAGNIKSYSIAGSALDTEERKNGDRRYIQVNKLDFQEYSLCEQGVNQGAHIDIIKSESAPANQELLRSISELDTLSVAGYGIYLKGNQLLVASDTENRWTDALTLQLSKAIPGVEVAVVPPFTVEDDAIPIWKIEAVPLWKDAYLSMPMERDTASVPMTPQLKADEDIEFDIVDSDDDNTQTDAEEDLGITFYAEEEKDGEETDMADSIQNQSHLVPKEVEVHRGGKTFKRRQMVRPDVSDFGHPKGSSSARMARMEAQDEWSALGSKIRELERSGGDTADLVMRQRKLGVALRLDFPHPLAPSIYHDMVENPSIRNDWRGVFRHVATGRVTLGKDPATLKKADDDTLTALKDWLDRNEERRETHRELLDEYVFPDDDLDIEDFEDEEDEYYEEEQPKPWVVNAAGKEAMEKSEDSAAKLAAWVEKQQRPGLVPKEVEVHRGGKVFKRTQMVRPPTWTSNYEPYLPKHGDTVTLQGLSSSASKDTKRLHGKQGVVTGLSQSGNLARVRVGDEDVWVSPKEIEPKEVSD